MSSERFKYANKLRDRGLSTFHHAKKQLETACTEFNRIQLEAGDAEVQLRAAIEEEQKVAKFASEQLANNIRTLAKIDELLGVQNGIRNT